MRVLNYRINTLKDVSDKEIFEDLFDKDASAYFRNCLLPLEMKIKGAKQYTPDVQVFFEHFYELCHELHEEHVAMRNACANAFAQNMLEATPPAECPRTLAALKKHIAARIEHGQTIIRDVRAGRGGYANVRGSAVPAVNATAAALFLLPDDARRETAEALQSLQQADGSFRAVPSAPQGDLPSTATAALALEACGRPLLRTAKPFLRACFRDTGLFAATPDDPVGDLEYTAYGLIAMGLTP